MKAGKTHSHRLNTLQNYYADKFVAYSSDLQFFYSSNYYIPNSKYKVYYLPKKYINQVKLFNGSNFYDGSQNNQLLQRIISFETCLSISNCNWLLTIDDDALVDLYNLNQLIFELKNNFNPRKDIIMKGNCFNHYAINLTYLQGGSGYILSRKACQLIIQNVSSNLWIYHPIEWEDFSTLNFFQILGIHSYNATSPYFWGHGFSFNDIEYLKKKKISKISNLSNE